MAMPAGHSEPILLSSSPVSVAVNEYVAARRLGLSVDTLRRDRRLGHLGIPFIKLGEGKRGLVRYDLADLERWVEVRKKVGRGTASQARPPVVEPPIAAQPTEQLALPVEPETVRELELLAPRRPSSARTPWEALAATALAEPEDEPQEDPFAVAGRAAPRRTPGGYFGG